MDERCERCIWACKRDHDTVMRLCKYLNTEVYGGSVPCEHYERFEDSFSIDHSRKSAVQ